MNFLEVIVLLYFEEQLSLVSEDLNICINTAFLADTQLKGPQLCCFGRIPFERAEQDQAPTCR